MQDLLNQFTSLFTFLISGLTTIANFFTTNLIGIIILGIAIFSIVWSFLMDFINRIHRR